jgi:sugar porter (SP) family MFS transporter
MISLVTALGGLLFGFDISVISGTIPFLQDYFSLNEAMKGWVVSSALLGCIAGAAFAGKLGDRWGRKKVLLVTSIFFGISAIGSGFSYSVAAFVFYRILGGLAVGAASMISPMFIAEVSPGHLRGRMVSINQLTIVLGISLAYYSNYFLLSLGENSWRWMFAAEAAPSLLFFAMLFFIPESPRWLVTRQKKQDAKAVLTKIGGNDFAASELTSIEKSFLADGTKQKLKAVFQPKYRLVLLLGILLAVFQQWSGINVIFFYAPDIFAKARLGIGDALFQTTLIGIVNILFTFFSMLLIDKTGRKKLMLTGSAGMTVCYFLIGTLFYTGNETGWALIVLILLTIAFFSTGLAPTVWVVISEIFPNKIRGVAMSVATFFLWVACYLLTLSFPVFVEWFSVATTFGIYGLICLAGAFIIFRFLPETKGTSLEELEKSLIKE